MLPGAEWPVLHPRSKQKQGAGGREAAFAHGNTKNMSAGGRKDGFAHCSTQQLLLVFKHIVSATFRRENVSKVAFYGQFATFMPFNVAN